MTHYTDKSRLRIEYLARRQAVSFDEMRVASKQACRHVIELMAKLQARNVSAYAAIRNELPLWDSMLALHKRKIIVSLPTIVAPGKPLAFRRWKPSQELIKGHYGTLVPPLDSPECVPDVLLVPLLAFDRKGGRLGYGGGYFDRTMESLSLANPHTKAVGIAYSLQEVAALPNEAHDHPLDYIVTETELITCEKVSA